MKTALSILATVVLLLGCSDGAPPASPAPPGVVPTSPPPPPTGSRATLWGMVIDQTGLCILGARVEVVRGQSVGTTLTQTSPCDKWDVGGFFIENLTPGVELTLRATAEGYAPDEKTFIPQTGEISAVFLTPAKIH